MILWLSFRTENLYVESLGSFNINLEEFLNCDERNFLRIWLYELFLLVHRW